MRYLIIFSIIIGLFSSSCKPLSKVQAADDCVKKTIKIEFGEQTELNFNSEKTFCLCLLRKYNPSKMLVAIDFGIYDINACKLIYKDQIRDGEIRWKTDYEILVKKKSEVYSLDPDVQKNNRYLISVPDLIKTTYLE